MAQPKAETRSETEEVWAREESYWRMVKSNDVKGWAELWGDDFVGWPHSKEHPIGKAEAVAVFKNGTMFGQVLDYELQRESVEKHGDAVIAFYRVKERVRHADGSESRHIARLSHTWMKRDGQWVIVGGMGAPETPSGAAH